MPGGRFAELNRGIDRPGLRRRRRLAVPKESAIRRIAMRRMASSDAEGSGRIGPAQCWKAWRAASS